MGSGQSLRKSANIKSNNFYLLVQNIKKGTPDIIKAIKNYPNWEELEFSDVSFI